MSDRFTRQQTGPTMRRLASIAIAALGTVVVLGLAAQVVNSVVVQRSMKTVERDAQSSALSSQLEVAVLSYQRMSNLDFVTREPELASARKTLRNDMQRLLVALDGNVGASQEQAAVDRTVEALDSYLAFREDAERDHDELDDVVSVARPALTTLLSEIESLRGLNDAQVLRARGNSQVSATLARIAAAGGAVILALALVVMGLGVRRYLLRPLGALHDTMARFRDGEHGVRADGGGLRELDDLSHMFNDMADTLDQQRKAQLTFLAGVAHDLKNPLATLKTGMYTLELESSEIRRSTTRAALDNQVDLLNRMVGDLLDATRIEAGELELRPRTFDLRPLVQDIVRLYEMTADEHRFEMALPPVAATVNADPLRLEQVLRNLLSNAIKFSPHGGLIRAAVAVQEGFVVFSIADQGIGILPEELPGIFLPFRRRRFGVAPGAGLGLSVVKRIVSAHGGRIDVQSSAGAGSTFRVWLPQAARGMASVA